MPIDQENFLVRGSTLMNTKWVIGVACYTGYETKIAKNGRRVSYLCCQSMHAFAPVDPRIHDHAIDGWLFCRAQCVIN